jgi:hypothetical protein
VGKTPVIPVLGKTIVGFIWRGVLVLGLRFEGADLCDSSAAGLSCCGLWSSTSTVQYEAQHTPTGPHIPQPKGVCLYLCGIEWVLVLACGTGRPTRHKRKLKGRGD